MARSIDVPVLSVSAAMSVIAVYRNDLKHTIQPTGWLHDRTDQALATMQRFRNRFDVALNGLSILEVEDTVSVGDVVGGGPGGGDGPAHRRGGGRLPGRAGRRRPPGRACSPPSWSTGWPPPSTWWSATTAACPPARPDRLAVVDRVVDQLAHLTSDELRRRRTGWPRSSACPGSFNDTESGVEPRGYRLLYRLPRFSDAIIERIVDRFVNLQQIMRASLGELEQVEGVGQARAHSVKDGLARLAEASIFERYQ